MQNLLRIGLVGWLLFSYTLPANPTPAPAIAPNPASTTPNGVPPKPKPGWGLWQPSSDITKANFSAGFSNTELGGFLDFQNACAQALGKSTDEVPYWFRLSNLVSQIGTGKAEFGCWKDGQWVSTMLNTAVSTKLQNVECLRVQVPTGEDLRVRATPGLNGKILGFIRNGSTVKPDSFPTSIEEANGRNWVAIRAPINGWISNDRPDTVGNLTLCH